MCFASLTAPALLCLFNMFCSILPLKKNQEDTPNVGFKRQPVQSFSCKGLGVSSVVGYQAQQLTATFSKPQTGIIQHTKPTWEAAGSVSKAAD